MVDSADSSLNERKSILGQTDRIAARSILDVVVLLASLNWGMEEPFWFRFLLIKGRSRLSWWLEVHLSSLLLPPRASSDDWVSLAMHSWIMYRICSVYTVYLVRVIQNLFSLTSLLRMIIRYWDPRIAAAPFPGPLKSFARSWITEIMPTESFASGVSSTELLPK